jgi:flagellum-specific ATP synthase
MTTATALLGVIQRAELVERLGRVADVRGALIESIGPKAGVGEQCLIDGAAGALSAEVVGFAAERTLLMPYGAVAGIAPGATVRACGQQSRVAVGPALLGRVVDAFGRPIDGRGALGGAVQQRALHTAPPTPMTRRRIDVALDTGVRVIDTTLTLAKGQRVGLFAGSGVGKSSLLAMMARGTEATVKVIALIGERAREVREFVEDQLGDDGLQRAVVVVATSSEPAIVRLRAAYAATAIAEHFRDGGQDVLLIMDSLTRFAMARREVGLAAGEPPTARGYTPSVFAEIPQLCERTGTHAGAGSITAIYSVLVEGDDMNEPISDAIRSTLDGHVVLSREIANGSRYPAIDVLKSVSRLRTAVSNDAEQDDVRVLCAALAVHERNRQLIEIGAYKPGINATLDRAVGAMPRIEAFLSQGLRESVGRGQAAQQLRELAKYLRGTDGQH